MGKGMLCAFVCSKYMYITAAVAVRYLNLNHWHSIFEADFFFGPKNSKIHCSAKPTVLWDQEKSRKFGRIWMYVSRFLFPGSRIRASRSSQFRSSLCLALLFPSGNCFSQFQSSVSQPSMKISLLRVLPEIC